MSKDVSRATPLVGFEFTTPEVGGAFVTTKKDVCVELAVASTVHVNINESVDLFGKVLSRSTKLKGTNLFVIPMNVFLDSVNAISDNSIKLLFTDHEQDPSVKNDTSASILSFWPTSNLLLPESSDEIKRIEGIDTSTENTSIDVLLVRELSKIVSIRVPENSGDEVRI